MQKEDVSWCEFSSDQMKIHAGQLWISSGLLKARIIFAKNE